MRIILYTGKGGVGKTSVAAATACRIAGDGRKVLTVSTDQAHSLSDSFGIKLGNEAVCISENLYGMEIDTIAENEKSWGKLKGYIDKIMSLKSEKSIESEELLVFPGFEELLSLIRIKQIYDSGEYDVIIVDCAPTGETMSLLKFPEMFRFWMDKFFPMKRKAAKFAKPIVEAAIKVPVPDDDIFDEIELLYSKIEELHTLMTSKDVVSIRIVTTPEKIVIREAKRSFSYLHLFDYNVDCVIINRIFPENSLSGYFSKWGKIQQESIADIYDSFSGIPVFKLELQNSELRNVELLKKAGELIYGEKNPEEIFFKDTIFSIEKNDNGYIFSISMPFVDKSELQMSQIGDELSISIKNERRVFSLPKKLHQLEISGAKYENGRLNIAFN